jgi:hypothetical protein
MKLSTLIAQQARDRSLRRIFIDFQKRVAMVVDGYHAAWARLENDDCLDTGGCAINLDPKRQESVFKPFVSSDQRVVSAIFDARFLLNCMRQLKSNPDFDETAEDVRVLVEIYRSKKDEGYMIAFAQEHCASLAMSLDKYARILVPWRPYLAEDKPKGTDPEVAS